MEKKRWNVSGGLEAEIIQDGIEIAAQFLICTGFYRRNFRTVQNCSYPLNGSIELLSSSAECDFSNAITECYNFQFVPVSGRYEVERGILLGNLSWLWVFALYCILYLVCIKYFCNWSSSDSFCKICSNFFCSLNPLLFSSYESF